MSISSGKNEARFLGIIIDEKLNWSKHILALKSKMCRYLGVMYKLKFSIPLKARLQIYHSFIQSHLNYCSVVWGFSYNSNIEKLLTMQKKGLRSDIWLCDIFLQKWSAVYWHKTLLQKI